MHVASGLRRGFLSQEQRDSLSDMLQLVGHSQPNSDKLKHVGQKMIPVRVNAKLDQLTADQS
jgi:hypothetical protein